ncbi:hypothetical protein [Arthrobacter rhizosphaerae]|uniref:hypothetical protein n=1 Tax=Arthrobacter rhizosphaerae TaxID=2855490 RepID=UPI001FF38A0C|nr:hypothetical protein [Arthrobacter rhizosphaerae]
MTILPVCGLFAYGVIAKEPERIEAFVSHVVSSNEFSRLRSIATRIRSSGENESVAGRPSRQDLPRKPHVNSLQLPADLD